jgi:hypothetical protein
MHSHPTLSQVVVSLRMDGYDVDSKAVNAAAKALKIKRVWAVDIPNIKKVLEASK